MLAGGLQVCCLQREGEGRGVDVTALRRMVESTESMYHNGGCSFSSVS